LVKSNQTARFNAGKQNKTNPEFFVSLGNVRTSTNENRQRTQSYYCMVVSDHDEGFVAGPPIAIGIAI